MGLDSSITDVNVSDLLGIPIFSLQSKFFWSKDKK